MESTLPQSQTLTPEVVEYEACYLFRFAVPESAKDDIKLEIIDNELIITNTKQEPQPHFPSFVFPRAIDAEQSRAAFVHGALTVIVPKRCFTKHFQLPIEKERQVRWKRLFTKQPHNHILVESPRIAHPHIASGYSENHASPVAMTTPERPECL